MLAVALALGLGAWTGRSIEPSPTSLAIALAALLGAWCTARALERELHGVRRPGWSTLALLSGLAMIGGTPRAAAPDGRRSGAWQPVQRSTRGVVGRLEHPAYEPVWLELPRGVVAPGEWIAVDPIDAPTLDARGPVPAPRALGERSDRRVWSVRFDELERLGPAPPWERSTGWLRDARSALVRRCRAFDAGQSRELARALLCGDSSELSPATAQLFNRTGLRHVLAVSGMHVTLLAALLIAPLSRTRLGRAGWTWSLACACGAALFSCMTGAEAPVRRAAVAVAATLLAPRLAGVRRADSVSLLALGVVTECALDVRVLFQLSFQLSYVATGALILGTRPIANLFRPPREARLGPTPLSAALAGALGRTLRGSLAASTSAVLFTLPWAWPAFGEWAPSGILWTALLTPVIGFMLVSGWLALALPLPGLAAAFDAASRALLQFLEFADRWPGTPHALPPRPAPLLLAIAALAAWSLIACRTRRGAALDVGDVRMRLALALAGVVLLPWSVRPAGCTIDALDVGHGTCVVVRGTFGPTWVFDCGSRDRGRVAPAALGPLLAAEEAGELVVVASHEDSDHAGDLDWVVERYPIRAWCGALPARIAERLPHTSLRADASGRGQGLTLAGLGFESATLLRGLEQARNESSRTLLLRDGGASFALHGDAVEDGLGAWLERATRAEGFEIVLWPHHGDDTAWSDRLLDLERPREVWISASESAPIEAELARWGVRVRSTALEGPLRASLSGSCESAPPRATPSAR